MQFTKLVPIYDGNQRIANVRYDKIKEQTMSDQFRVWLVIYHPDVPQEIKTWWRQKGYHVSTNPYTALRYRTWNLERRQSTSTHTVTVGKEQDPDPTVVPITNPPVANNMLNDSKSYEFVNSPPEQ